MTADQLLPAPAGGLLPAPAIVVECELADGIPRLPCGDGATQAVVLARIFSEPLGLLNVTLTSGGIEPDQLARSLVDEFGPQLRERLEECGVAFAGTLPTDGIQPPRTPRFLIGRAAVMRDGPEITAAVCTRDRPQELAIALQGLADQEYPRLDVVVVDNAPADDRTLRLVATAARTQPLRYVVEPRPGLSWARNRAIDATGSEVIAWVDDDEAADRWWACEVARAFVEVPEAGAMTGLVVPSELATPSQVLFERYSGVSRGRGFARAIFSPATRHQQSPLYPLPPFGAGANMAFRRDAIQAIGRFDCALGAGTSTLAGEDTAALSSLLLAGGTVVYQPTAIVRHRHRRDYEALRRVMLGYGRGLGAFYASMLISHPSCALELFALSRRAVADQLSRGSRRLRELNGFPPELLALNRRGVLQGALMYPLARRRAHRLAGCVSGR